MNTQCGWLGPGCGISAGPSLSLSRSRLLTKKVLKRGRCPQCRGVILLTPALGNWVNVDVFTTEGAGKGS